MSSKLGKIIYVDFKIQFSLRVYQQLAAKLFVLPDYLAFGFCGMMCCA